MIDTVNLIVKPVQINPTYLLKLQPNPKTYLDHPTGSLKTTYKMYDEQLPYIVYNDYSQILIVQVSIPKFLYGNNVYLIQESDIPLFFHRLSSRLYELFAIHVKKEDWYVSRIDLCWNFQLGDEVENYIKQLHGLYIPYMKSKLYGRNETATHFNDSRYITFYNKQQECKDHKEPAEIIAKAQGLLRMEVSLSYDEMRKYSSKRLAIHLISKAFFIHTFKPSLETIQLPATIDGLSLEWFKSQSFKLNQIESVLSFQALHNWLTDSEVRQLYKPSTYANRKKLSKQIIFPSQRSLRPLAIDFDNLG
ncbi:hypothetical protein PAESOLCIP111_05537 [Paenibacillus solanacearum]|uniref:Replication-associated protein G2P N-terminal domain-containing protein n=1 Tax=Paenibacillus solanacearum TaxID=2048548 RepID=A0A916NLF4_9BACL|nr:phage/plasmid replication protein [Paenibacillus solanacearum]CAG7648146.1 hypothetical protein PAESOLCIP111_05537 [Paenibacillus solanacearum]